MTTLLGLRLARKRAAQGHGEAKLVHEEDLEADRRPRSGMDVERKNASKETIYEVSGCKFTMM